MKLLMSLFVIMFSTQLFAQSCPSDMEGITTTSHPVLRVAGRDVTGHLITGVGDPNTDIRNWQNGIYNSFMEDGGSTHFYYDTVIYNQVGPIITSNDNVHEIGACNENGQCVQVRFQVTYSTVTIPGYVRRILGRGVWFPAIIQTRPSSVNISYTAPDGMQHNLEIQAVNGVMPPNQPVANNQPARPSCLNNEGEVLDGNDTGDSSGGGDDDGSELSDYWGGEGWCNLPAWWFTDYYGFSGSATIEDFTGEPPPAPDLNYNGYSSDEIWAHAREGCY